MKLTKKQISKYRKELVVILKRESGAILAAMRLLAPRDTGLLADTLKLNIKDTGTDIVITVSSDVDKKARIKNGRSIKPRDYFYPYDNESYMGPRSIKRAGQIDKGGKKIQPFLTQPLDDALDRALDTILAKYGIRLGVGWRGK